MARYDRRDLFKHWIRREQQPNRPCTHGSEELLNYFEENPRPTEAYFRGEDTRVGYLGVRRRLSRQEQREREYYERLEYEERNPLSAA